MGKKSRITTVVFAIFLIAGAAAAYAYDDSRKSEIADGVTINGISVGGMIRTEAEKTLKKRVLDPQRRPVVVKFKEEKFKLPAKQLKVRADVNAAVDRAFEESRSGSLPGRVLRAITGGKVNESIPVSTTYSKPAVNQFVRDVAEGVRKDPVDASIAAGADSLSVVKAENGHKLRDNLLTSKLESLLNEGNGKRVLAAKVNTLKPEVSTEEVAAAYPTYLTLDRGGRTLRLWKDLELAETYTVAVGQIGRDTPGGLYTIQNKAVDPAWSVPNSDWTGDLAGQVIPGGVPENPLKARWLGIFDGVGIHGTDDVGSLGTAASHGCIRMEIPDVEALYERVDVGTPIFIG